MNIVGGGLSGCVIARLLKDAGYDVAIYEKNEIGGLCRDNENYQEFSHIFHTNDDEVYQFISKYTTVKPYVHFVLSYSRGEYLQFPPQEMTDEAFDRLMLPYSIKMWGSPPPEEAKNRIKNTYGGYFTDKYQGILNSTELFKNLTKDIEVIKSNIKDMDNVILTGAVDEYFNYSFGKLKYVGMKSTHCQSELRLPTGAVHFPDLDIPFVRMFDYDKYGYKGGWIGFEFPSKSEKHYPVRDDESLKIYKKYQEMAKKRGVILAGRLGKYKYLDMDDCIREAIDDFNNHKYIQAG